MAVSSHCPQCRRAVTIPEGIAPDALVCCPLCKADYPASEALAEVPPVLIVLQPGAAAPQKIEPAVPTPPPAAAPAEEAGAVPPVIEAVATIVEGLPIDEGLQFDEGLEIEEEGPASGAREALPVEEGLQLEEGLEVDEGLEVEEGPQFDDWHEVRIAPQTEDTGGYEIAETGGGDGGALAVSDRGQPATEPIDVSLLLTKRKRRERSLVTELIGVVFGGFLGLAIGYYLLNLLGGSQFDFLKIYMPGVKHTDGNWPFAKPSSAQRPGGATPAPAVATPTTSEPVAPAQEPSSPPAPPPEAQPAESAPPETTPSAAKAEPATEPKAEPAVAEPPPAEPPAEPKTEPPAEVQPPPEPKTEPTMEAETKVEVEPNLDLPPLPPPAKPDAKIKVDLEPEPKPEPTTEPKPEPQPPSVVQPQPEPKPEPQPKAAVSEAPGPRNPPAVAPSELAAAIKAVQDAGAPAAAGMSPEAYQRFCRLGHALAFADATDSQSAQQRQAAQALLEGLAKSPDRIAEIERLAGGLLSGPDAAKAGVLLAGTSGKVASQEGLHGTNVRLAGQPEAVTVLSKEPLAFAAGDRVLVLGSIIANPAENFNGYKGKKSFLVWAALAVKGAP